MVNLVTNQLVRIIGKVENTERFLQLAVYQGGLGKKSKKVATLANAQDKKTPTSDPTLLCCAFKKNRLYLFRWGKRSGGQRIHYSFLTPLCFRCVRAVAGSRRRGRMWGPGGTCSTRSRPQMSSWRSLTSCARPPPPCRTLR